MKGTSPGLRDALSALKARRGKPGEHDRPRPTPFPGRKIKALPGQLDLEGNEVPGSDEDPAAA